MSGVNCIRLEAASNVRPLPVMLKPVPASLPMLTTPLPLYAARITGEMPANAELIAWTISSESVSIESTSGAAAVGLLL